MAVCPVEDGKFAVLIDELFEHAFSDGVLPGDGADVRSHAMIVTDASTQFRLVLFGNGIPPGRRRHCSERQEAVWVALTEMRDEGRRDVGMSYSTGISTGTRRRFATGVYRSTSVVPVLSETQSEYLTG